MTILVREASVKDFTDVYQFICELQGKVFDKETMQTLYNENISNEIGRASCRERV